MFSILEENLGSFLNLCQKKLGIVYSGTFIQAQAQLMFEELQEVGYVFCFKGLVAKF